jgi:hypothetical protein
LYSIEGLDFTGMRLSYFAKADLRMADPASKSDAVRADFAAAAPNGADRRID